MTSAEIRDKFLAFFENRNHTIIPSAPVVPENDPSSLFTTAGMQPLVPYLLGQTHPAGNRLVNIQKCVRTNDIDEVGDATHLTFFQMLGNWSLGNTETGGYGRKEAIEWSWQLLTDSEEGFGLDPERLYITVFAGNDDAPRDDEAAKVWQSLGVPRDRIYYLDGKSNWWSPGDNGPCGPSSEMFYDVTMDGLSDMTHDEFMTADDNLQVVEIWNDVFMEYEKKNGSVVGKLAQPNIDTGAGLERLAAVLQKVDNIYQTDLFSGAINHLESFTSIKSSKDVKIVVEHIRSACVIISDGVLPSNTDQGYVLRRLIRRAAVSLNKLGLNNQIALELPKNFFNYLDLNLESVESVLAQEFQAFNDTLEKGLREFEKISDSNITGAQAFKLFSTYGFPFELTKEIATELKLEVDEIGFQEEFKKHQEASKSGSEQKFKGGLAGDDEMSVKYHTATHLLHAALRDVLGEHVEQRGSNITPDRLRFDFSHPEKLTSDEKEAVEQWVNDKIQKNLAVTMTTMDKDSAIESGAIGLFGNKYGDQVTVYTIGSEPNWVSRELCGGPHVSNTGELGTFKIKKEQASSAGVRRIKAILQ